MAKRTKEGELQYARKWYWVTGWYVFFAKENNPQLKKIVEFLSNSSDEKMDSFIKSNSHNSSILRFLTRWGDLLSFDTKYPEGESGDSNHIMTNRHLFTRILNSLQNLDNKSYHDDCMITIQINLHRPLSLLTESVRQQVEIARKERDIQTDQIIFNNKHGQLEAYHDFLNTYFKYTTTQKVHNQRGHVYTVEEFAEKVAAQEATEREKEDPLRMADIRRNIRRQYKRACETIALVEEKMLKDCENMDI
jgi:hypothetical protein